MVIFHLENTTNLFRVNNDTRDNVVKMVFLYKETSLAFQGETRMLCDIAAKEVQI